MEQVNLITDKQEEKEEANRQEEKKKTDRKAGNLLGTRYRGICRKMIQKTHHRNIIC